MDFLDANDFVLVPHSQELTKDLTVLSNLIHRLLVKNQLSTALIAESFSAKTSSEVNTSLIRNDLTLWVSDALSNPDLTEAERAIINKIEKKLQATVESLRQYFRFPLTGYEAHFAAYPPGHFYARHSDQKKKDNKRYFSFVIYLNESWQTADGGELVLYSDQQQIKKILPGLEEMIVFKSHVEHEVLPGHRNRYSLTGWIRNDN